MHGRKILWYDVGMAAFLARLEAALREAIIQAAIPELPDRIRH